MSDLRYLALLRGVNVGGKSLIRMADLAADLTTDAKLGEVRTYIQSGNVLFTAPPTDEGELARTVSTRISERFSLDVDVVVFSAPRWRAMLEQAPSWWGERDDFKHNLLALIDPLRPDEVLAAIGEPKEGIEHLAAGERVVYQSLSLAAFNQTASRRKLVANPVYHRLTIRNHRTARKLQALLGGDLS